jgi:arylsulfatase
LQALPEDIERYRGKYRRGWEEIRQERWQKMNSLGIAGGTLSNVERDLGPPWEHPEAIKALGPGEFDRPLPWTVLDEVQQDFQATKMAIHAAMIDRIDREVGRVLEQLRAMKAFDNTLILFLSDNGASAEIMVRDDGHDPNAAPGSAATHLCLGPGWSTTSNTPFRRHKVWVHEGGISTPLIAHWPQGISKHNELRRNPGHVIDIVPTVLEVAGGRPFENWDGKPVPNAPGKSLVPAFTSDNTVSHDYFWWFHVENRAIRIGDWKLVASGNDSPWELYDLKTDRAESNNLAKTQPAKATELEQAWNQHLKEFHTLATQDLPTAK